MRAAYRCTCSDVRCGDGFQYQYGEASGRIASAHHLQNGTNLGEQSRRTHPLRRPHPHLYTTPSTIVVALSITRLVYRRTRRRNTASESPPPPTTGFQGGGASTGRGWVSTCNARCSWCTAVS
jgi:hypothetical protein